MNNLKLPLVAPNQNQKELTINDQALALDAAFSEILDVDFTEGPQTLSEEEFTRNFTFNCANLGDDEVLTVQPVKRLFSVQNSSAYDVTVDVFNATGDTVVIEPGEMAILHCDGVNVRTAVAGGQVEGVRDIDELGFYVRVEGEWVEVDAGDNVSLDLVDGKLVISTSGGGADLPDMEGNKGKVLTVNEDEDEAIWATPTGGGGGGGIDDVLSADPHVRVNGEWLKLVADSGVSFDDSVEGELRVSASGGGSAPLVIGYIGSRDESGPSGSSSSSAYATKGHIIDITKDAYLFGLDTYLAGPRDGEYKIYIARLSQADDTIVELVHISDSLTLTTATGTLYTFNFDSAIKLAKGERYAVMIVLVSGSPTDAVRNHFPSQVGYNSPWFDYYGCVRYESNDPQINDDVLYSQTASVYMEFNAAYSLTDALPTALFPDMAGNAGKALIVNANEDGLEWS